MTRKTWRTWTRKELQRLEELRLAGLTAQRIADELGRTLASVKCRLCQEEIPRTYLTTNRWLMLLSGPHTIAWAAAEMGVKKPTVIRAKNRLRRAGFRCPPATREAS